MARLLGRVRLSRDTDESTSPERQIEHIENYAAMNDHEITGWAIDLDVSRSVNPFEAPELGPWLTDPLKIDSWDLVASWKLDRVAIGSVYLSKMIEFCNTYRKNLVSVTESFDLSTWIGRMIAQNIAAVAEGEWELIRDRNAGSAAKLRKDGRWRGGRANYWLKPKRRGKGYWLTLDPETSPVMREIIRQYLAHNPIDSIARSLSIDPDNPGGGYLTPAEYLRHRKCRSLDLEDMDYPESRRPITGAVWNPQSIRELLFSPALLGFQEHEGRMVRDENGNPIPVGEALITPSEFEQIMAERDRRAALRDNGVTEREANAGPLLRIAVCPECGTNLHYRTQRKVLADGSETEYLYYKFYCKHGPILRAEELEEEVHALFLMALGPLQQVERVFIPASDNTLEIENSRKALDELYTERAEVKSETAKEAIKAAIRFQDTRLAELEKTPKSEARYEYIPKGRSYFQAWNSMDESERRNLILESGITVAVHPKGSNRNWSFNLDLQVPHDMRERLGLPVNGPIENAFPMLNILKRMPGFHHEGSGPKPTPFTDAEQAVIKAMFSGTEDERAAVRDEFVKLTGWGLR
ncbi:recombinase family protein [Amycolatopsis rubida]|uniref:Site-specific DNA recombinase n=1 Tax=Amycolatopsis rubida TaxID=112413 RepID=A0A1I5MFL0_9PSEU|nr:recombinase family protein [Amycolatopsis rubida]SFP08289.1 Site-specific DNA recombinase [Amycolatopsis rubida]